MKLNQNNIGTILEKKRLEGQAEDYLGKMEMRRSSEEGKMGFKDK